MKIHCLWLLALLLGARAVVAAEPPAQKLLPRNTLLVVTAPDTGKALEVLTNSSFGRLWRDPKLKAFKDKFNAKLQSAAVGPLERQLGIHFADYQGLAQGQMTFAVVPVDHPAAAQDRNASVFILDTGGHAAQLASNLVALKKKWIDAGKTMKTENIRDKEFATFMMTSDDLSLEKLLPGLADNDDAVDILTKPPPQNVELTFGQSGSLLIVSQSSQVIEKILARQAGGLLPGLDEQPDFQRDFAARLQGAPLFAWINAGAYLAEAAKPQDAPGGPSLLDSFAGEGAFETLGLSGLTTVSASYHDTPEGLNLQLFVGAPESSRHGLLAILATESRDSGPPPFVPADAVKFSRMRLDLPKSWRLLQSFLDDANPAAAQMLNSILDLAGKSDDPKYDLKTELPASLGDDLITYQRNPVNMTLGDLQQAPEIYLIGSPNPWKLGMAIKAAAGLLVTPAGIKDREFLGRRIYSLSLPATPQGGSHTFYFAASSGYVALTGDVDMMEEFLRSNDSDKPGLSQTPGLADAAQKAGGGMSAGIFSYENDKESMRALLETLRKDSISASELLGLLGLEFGQEKISGAQEVSHFKDWCDFSLLPPTDALTPYFTYSVWVGGFTPEGFRLNCFTPAPPH